MDFDSIIEKGNEGIPILAESILPNIDNPEFCLGACKAVSSMAVDDESRAIFSEAGIMIDLIEILIKHKKDRTVTSGACNAIRSVIFDSAENIMEFVLNGGVGPLLETLKEYALDEEVCSSICASISFLGLSELCVNKVVEKQGILLVLGALQNHISSEEVCFSGCSALMILTSNKENKTMFGQNGGMLVLVNMLNEHINSSRMCEQICCTISGIVMGNQQNKVDLAVVGGIKSLINAMNTNSDSCPVAQWALSSLCAITYIIDNIRIANELKPVHIIVEAMKKFSGDLQVVFSGCGTLRNLMEPMETLEPLEALAHEEGIKDLLAKIKTTHASNKSIVTNAEILRQLIDKI